MSCDFERDEVRAELVNSTLLLQAVSGILPEFYRATAKNQLERNKKALKGEGKVLIPPIGDETSHSLDTP